jgi:hypothetical protein
MDEPCRCLRQNMGVRSDQEEVEDRWDGRNGGVSAEETMSTRRVSERKDLNTEEGKEHKRDPASGVSRRGRECCGKTRRSHRVSSIAFLSREKGSQAHR